MGKMKKPRIDSDALLKKKSSKNEKKLNPFEIYTSRPKYAVLDRDPTSLRGAPGVSRGKAMEQRKQTLGEEFRQRNKTNRFKDHRPSERSLGHDQLEEAQRRAEQKSMSSRRKEMYNLNENVMLTHKGQTLEEIERFDDGVDNEDSDDEAGGRLDAEFTEAVNFGGGEDDGNHRYDRKTVIEEMIAESKRRKVEKQRDNEQLYEMTQKLDKNWLEVIPLVGKLTKTEDVKPKLDDYDRTMREMIFERRGKPADKIKSEEELAKIEKEKLERLENERQARMRGDDEESKKIEHRSADDLDDGYFLQPIAVTDEQATAYDEDPEAGDGLFNARNVEIVAARKQEAKVAAMEAESADEDEGGEEGSEEEEEEEDGSEAESEDSLEDLKNDSESECEDEEEVVKNGAHKNGIQEVEEEQEEDEDEEEKKQKLIDRKSVMEKAAKELPYTFQLPETYEDLEKLLAKRLPEYQTIIIDRMLKSNNPRFVRDGKKKMVSLFAFLVQHLNDIFTDIADSNIENSFKILDKFTPFLYDLCQINPEDTSICFQEVLKEKQEDSKKKSKQYPDLDTLVFLKLVPLLFPATDFRHPIATPAVVFISKILSRCLIRNRQDITKGLLLVTTLLEFTEVTKRILPAALNFLNGILYMCVVKRPILALKVVPPFKATPPHNSLLVLEASQADNKSKDLKLLAKDFVATEIDDDFRVRALNTTVHMVQHALRNMSENVAATYVAQAFLNNLEKIDADEYPESVRKNIEKASKALQEAAEKKLHYLVQEQRKPKPLRLIEPKIENIYDDIRRRPKTPLTIKQDRDRLLKKVKKETKGAVREIRRDSQFISKMQFNQRMQSDRVRKDKVKRIFSEASSQQGELNSLDRKAKYKK